MYGVVFVGGLAPNPERRRELALDACIVVAADSGLITAEEAELRPEFIVGDMDSLKAAMAENRLNNYPKECVFRSPHDKDFTDTEIALNLLLERGCSEVCIIGGGGGRLAHTIALTSLFDRFANNTSIKLSWVTNCEEVFFLNNELQFNVKIGTILSVFPAGNGPWKSESEGLHWKLDAVEWKRGNHGISNRADSKKITLRAINGAFLVVLEKIN